MTYLDYQATTPLAPEALDAMLPWLRDGHANPHSAHREGRRAKAAVEVAREEIVRTLFHQVVAARPDAPDDLQVPWVLGTPPWDAVSDAGQLIFTSGATEALNWAIKGSFERATPGRRRIVTVATEHAAVLESVCALETRGADVVVLPVDRTGLIDPQHARDVIDETTALVVAMYVNNEIGTIQHIGLLHLAERARAMGAPMICDAVQAYGKMTIPMAFFDLVAVSAHKMHGPKAIGALWVRRGYQPTAFMDGGGQEVGLRSGTLSPALCAGFGAAARVARERWDQDTAHVYNLYNRARETFRLGGWHVNGHRLRRYHGNLNVRLPGLDVARLMSDLRDIAFSAGSACASGSGRPSHVLRAIGLTDAEARSSIRLGFGRYTAEGELLDAVTRIDAAARAQRRVAA